MWIDGLGLQQLGSANNAIERGAQLMADVVYKLRLNLAGSNRFFVSDLQIQQQIIHIVDHHLLRIQIQLKFQLCVCNRKAIWRQQP